ncbi:MAG: YggS family pyridoxal phosphate-dependent enzyme [Flavobacterium sp.]
MNIRSNLERIAKDIDNRATLVVVTKTRHIDEISEVYDLGYREFGENKVQELCEKYELLPKDINWHAIGHLQTNKVKYIAPFVSLIHSVDSKKLLEEIDRQAIKNNRVISCLLQIHIAEEETKYGLDEEELKEILNLNYLNQLKNINIVGLMGMATFTTDLIKINTEFSYLKSIFDKLQFFDSTFNFNPRILSMGMSGDYVEAIAKGSNMVRVGSSIFKI